MDFTFDGHKGIGKVSKEIGFSGIENEVKIIIFFCFIVYPGPDPLQLYFTGRTLEQLNDSVNNALGRNNRQIKLAVDKLIEFGYVRMVEEKYKLTRAGKAAARALYDISSISSENYDMRREG